MQTVLDENYENYYYTDTLLLGKNTSLYGSFYERNNLNIKISDEGRIEKY